MLTRVDTLTQALTQQMGPHAERWIGIGLATGPADREGFQAAARQCYAYAQLPWHNNVVWVSSPLVTALAAPLAALLLQVRGPLPAGELRHSLHEALDGGVREAQTLSTAVGDAVEAVLRGAAGPRRAEDGGAAPRDIVLAAVRGAVRGPLTAAMRDRVRDGIAAAVSPAVRRTVHEGVRDPVDLAVRVTVDMAVRDAVRDVVCGVSRKLAGDGRTAAPERLRPALGDALSRAWYLCIGGQLGISEFLWGPVYTSFFREVCQLALPGDVWERARTYEQTVRSACWWYPHRDFIVVSERPRQIHRERARRGEGMGPLHRSDGPAVTWPDGWGIYADHGRLVPRGIIEDPGSITLAAIENQKNAEVRRVMIERYGWNRYIRDCGAQVVDIVPMDHPIMGLRGACLLRKTLRGEPEPVVYLDMRNSTPEPDGTHRRYLARVDPSAYGGDAGRLCHAAQASLWRYRDEQGTLRLTFPRWQDYRPLAES